MEKIRVCESDNLRENLKKAKELGYNFVVKAKDGFLSGWGGSGKNGHIHLILCRDMYQLDIVLNDLRKDNSMLYIDWQRIENIDKIIAYTRNKSFTLRNDWTRAFKEDMGGYL